MRGVAGERAGTKRTKSNSPRGLSNAGRIKNAFLINNSRRAATADDSNRKRALKAPFNYGATKLGRLTSEPPLPPALSLAITSAKTAPQIGPGVPPAPTP